MTKAENYLNAKLPALGSLYIDNYDELVDNRDAPSITVAVQCINDFFRENGGIVWRYEPGRFHFILEIGDLNRVLRQKFALLDKVREIATPSALPITLSIAVGIADTLQEAYASSRQAMELALGRGGDQAVIKRDRNFRFYGGKKQPGERYSRVKSRVVAQALAQLMRSYDNVYLMGHKMADYDSLGACLGIAACAQALNKSVEIVLEPENDMIDGIMRDISLQEAYASLFVTPEQAAEACGPESLLVVLDTQTAASTPAPELLESAGAIAVIDHHRRGVAAIAQSALQFVQVHASSTCELIVEIVQYFQPEVPLSPLLSSALLSGIAVDTKHFSVNTGVRTFEAAAYLRKHGADANYVKQLFQDDTQHYLERAEIVRRAEFVRPHVVLSFCDASASDAPLLAAQAADILVGMRGIQAAFVLAKTDHGIHVSARSSGEINVQLVLESLGGGGHMNVAGAQFTQSSIDSATKHLIHAIDHYFEELA